MTLGNRIRTLLAAAGVNPSQASNASMLSKRTWYDVCAGTKLPNWRTLSQMAQFFGLGMSEMLEGVDYLLTDERYCYYLETLMRQESPDGI